MDQRSSGQRTATELGISPSTVSRTFHRLRLIRIKDIEPLPPPRRYECSRSGEMIHIDIKKLAHFKAPEHQITGWHTGMHRSCGAGWEDLTRLHRRLFPWGFFCCDARQNCPKRSRFPPSRGRHHQNVGITIECAMTDNGPCGTSKVFCNLAPISTFVISVSDTAPREPTERPNDSYKPPSGNGLYSRLSDLLATMRSAFSLVSLL